MTRPYPFPATAGVEPTFEEMLVDPTMHALLARDGLLPKDLDRMIRYWRVRRVLATMRLLPAA